MAYRQGGGAAEPGNDWTDRLHKWIGTFASILTIGTIMGAVYGVLLLKAFLEKDGLHGATLQMYFGASIIGAFALLIVTTTAILLSLPAYVDKNLRNYLSFYDFGVPRLIKKFDIYFAVHGPSVFSILALLNYVDKNSASFFTVLSFIAAFFSIVRLFLIRSEAQELHCIERSINNIGTNIFLYFSMLFVMLLIEKVLPKEFLLETPIYCYLIVFFIFHIILSFPSANGKQYFVIAFTMISLLNPLILFSADSIVSSIVIFNKLGGYKGTFSLTADAYEMLPGTLRENVAKVGDASKPGKTKPVCVVLRMADMVYIRPLEAYEDVCHKRIENRDGAVITNGLYAFKEDQIIDVGPP
jgi:hypothetical protein